MPATPNFAYSFSRAYRWAGYMLGFAMGGFFDGILLHQILQWHHLLSALESDPFRDLRTQILADGIFHALMYVIMAIGLWKLWQTAEDNSGHYTVHEMQGAENL